MTEFFSKLFTLFEGAPDEPAKDGLVQEQREALIDLLLLATYADNHLSLAEKEILEDQTLAFDWQSGSALEIYVEEATAKVRGIEDHDEFLTDLSKRLGNEDTRRFALDLCKQLFQADADVGFEEITFLNELRSTLLPE